MFGSLLISITVLTIALFGHLAICVAIYNRFNASGIPRAAIKVIEKVIVSFCALLPVTLFWFESQRPGGWQSISIQFASWNLHWLTTAYLCLAIIACIVMIPRWVLDRPWMAQSAKSWRMLASESLQPIRQDSSHRKSLISGKQFHAFSYLPGNQIASLERNIKRIYVPSLPKDLEQLSIAHISDVHLTGQLSEQYYRLAMDWVVEQRPDLIVVAGDIVDYDSSVSQLKKVFSQLQSSLGMYFVLGNHDRRLRQPLDICEELKELGWKDLGVSSHFVRKGDTCVQLIGNEEPWFRRKSDESSANPMDERYTNWKLGVSHSPDQFHWASALDCNLLLCGHTHGGQIRVPFVGPIISPSWYGSRYASGVFRRGNCVMHVSRGLSSVHPVRFRCLPEVSILMLSSAGKQN